MTIERVGVIGGGQLAWMMGPAARQLGISLAVQTPHASDPAVSVASEAILAPIDDAAASAKLAEVCDAITFENEFVNLEALRPLARQGVCFRPSLESLAPLLDKYRQREYLKGIGLPVPHFTAVSGETLPRLDSFPAVLKTRRHGYDGLGTFIVDSQGALETVWKRVGQAPMLLEAFVPFERELAVIAARSVTGDVAIYPVVETEQEAQVCRRVIVPAELPPGVVREVEEIARHLLERLEFVGVVGIELFLTAGGQLSVNEIAPRTHNSGHYTLDACQTSQFEMQLRAVAERPLGSPALKSSGAAMVNLLGYEHSQSDYREKRQQLAALPHAYLHWYGKIEARPGRKLGHITVVSDRPWGTESPQDARQRMLETVRQVEAIWYG